jgi:hypothetical protein
LIIGLLADGNLLPEGLPGLAKTAIEFPPMQAGASFNLEVIKEKVEKAMASRAGQ